MKKVKWILILVNTVLLLLYFNFAILKKEQILDQGKLIFLELAPVDPRSLMQGDYMALRYKISNNEDFTKIDKRGYCVVTLSTQGIAEKVRLQPDKFPLKPDEHLINCAVNQYRLNIGAESFFFQEGHANRYEKAKYGAVKIDGNGNSLLVGLYDEQLKELN
jgi:uncharacterized membrane-anchored protein